MCFELDEPDENTHVASFQMLVHANSCDDALEQCERRLRELHATGKHFVQPCSIYLLHAIRLPTVMSGPALVNFSDTVIYREDTGHDHVRRRRPARHRSRQLDDAVRRFAADRTKNRYDRATHTLYVSSIFKWFQEDFERSAGGRLAYVASFAPDSMHPAMSAPRLRVELLDYDWSLNGR